MYKYSQKVTASLADSRHNLKMASLFDLLADCEQLQIDHEPGIDENITKNGIGIFLCSRQTDILRVPAYGETLTAATYIYEMTHLTGKRNTLVFDERGQVVISGYAVGAFVDLSTGNMRPVDRTYAASMKTAAAFDMEYLPRKIALPDVEPQICPDFIVPRRFIDSYKHMNNAKYVAQASEYLDDEAAVKRVRVEYKLPAVHKDALTPYIYKTKNLSTVVFKNADKKESCVIEFTLND